MGQTYDGTLINSIGYASVPGLPHLANTAANILIFPDDILPQLDLLSPGQLCDEGCTAIADADPMTILNPDGTMLYHGTHNFHTFLWDVD